MSKELFVSSTPHETKVAVVEEDQLTEVYFERENEYTLAGSIYKGRVTRVLPGMQSAFVNVGLERDAFLYVTDFLLEEEDDADGLEQVVMRSPTTHVEFPPREAQAETRQEPMDAMDAMAPLPAAGLVDEAEEEGPAEVAGGEGGQDTDREGARKWRGRRRRGRGRARPDDREPRASEPAQESRPREAGEQGMGGPEAPSPEVSHAEVSQAESRGQNTRGQNARHQDTRHQDPRHQDTRHQDTRGPEPRPREAGFPEARPRAETHPGPSPEYPPIVLPGESISKYQPRSASEPSAPVAPPPARTAHAPASTEYPSGPLQGYTPGSMVLPGETISKYQRGETRRPAVAPPEARPQSSVAGPEVHSAEVHSAEVHSHEVHHEAHHQAAPPPGGARSAEWRGLNSHAGGAVEEPPATPAIPLGRPAPLENSGAGSPIERAEPSSMPAGYPAPPPGNFRSTAPDLRIGEVVPDPADASSVAHGVPAPSGNENPPPPAGRQPATPMAAEREAPLAIKIGRDVPEPDVEEPQFALDTEEQQRIERLLAASAAGEPSAGASGPAEVGDQAGHQPGDSTPPFPRQASGAGVVEEEEIEDEELFDLPDFEEELDLVDYEELEEQVLNPAEGGELTEAVREAHVSEQATGQYETEGLEEGDPEDPDFFSGAVDEDEEDDDEDEGQELSPGLEGSGEAEEAEDFEGTRAEMRAPATAGFQQRTERGPAKFDRRGPARKQGRHMRGRPARHPAQRAMPAIADLLKEGQEILVQIAKEPIAKKGARITSHIALPGRFLVFMPTVHHTGVSRKIASEEERLRLKRIVVSERGEMHGGFIVRTAAAGANEDDLRADIRFLINLWTEIRGRAEKSKAPSLIYHDLNLVERILRDQVTTSFSSIWVDTEQEYERILRFVSRFQPSLVKRVKLYTKDTPLFEQFNIGEEIDKALKSKVWLKSGGYIVINQTEALVAIDVNTGKYVGKTARLEDTIVKTNVDAIKEIVRQIRLRDLGGIIVIDFIDMDERKNRHKVMQALEEALRADRAPSKVLQFNDFGLVAITRKRVKQSLERTLGQPCTTCTGTGMIKSVTTVCNEIYVEMRKMARHFNTEVVLRVHPEVAKALKTSGGRWLQEMEELTRHTIITKADPLLHPEQFDIQ